MMGNDLPVDCFTVLIQGKEKLLFFEHIDPRFTGRLGRWFVEKIKIINFFREIKNNLKKFSGIALFRQIFSLMTILILGIMVTNLR